VILGTQGLVAESFRGFHDIRLATLFGGVFTSVLSGLLFAGLWLIQGHSDLGQIVTFSIVAAATNVLIGFLFLRIKLEPKGLEPDLTARTVLGIAWPIWITNLALVVLTQADLWIVGMFRAQEEVAIYGAAARFAVIVSMPLMIVNAIVPSLIADLYTKGAKNDLRDALRASASVAVIPAFFVLAIFIFFGTPILGIVYGDHYRDGAIVLALLGVGQFVNVWAGSCGMVLLMTGNQALMMLISIACGVINISAAVLVVDGYGLNGVAAVAAATMILQNGLMLMSSKWKTGMWTHATFSRLSFP
jgi:O-antigen/teichoic acid export membrane protein